ncbi:MAG TPA: hypothetical protein VEB20_25790 [Azospirillaceae bacterium]|nr:hypothetical protein [Azospirillaceae bacterium]
MTATSRLALGFAAGFLSHVIFQGALGTALHAAGVNPSLPWSLAPVPPLGVPHTLNLGFWDGLWGIAYALLEPRLTARTGRLPGGLVFGAAALLVDWFVVLPLKGFGVGGGFHPAALPVEFAYAATFGASMALLYHAGLRLAERPVPR